MAHIDYYFTTLSPYVYLAGTRLVNVFKLGNRWRTVDEVEATRLSALARERKAHRTLRSVARSDFGLRFLAAM